MIKPTDLHPLLPTLFFTIFANIRIYLTDNEVLLWFLCVQSRQLEQEADTKPVVASKIPVGSFRVEEERRINRALSRERSSGAMRGGARIVRERSMSRIPVFSTNSPSNNVGLNYSYNLRRIAVPLLFPRLYFIKQFA